MRRKLALIVVMVGLGLTAGFAQVEKPSDLKYPALKYEPPDPKAFRTSFANGLRGYVQEDHSLPLVNLSATDQLRTALRRQGKGRAGPAPGGGPDQGRDQIESRERHRGADRLSGRVAEFHGGRADLHAVAVCPGQGL